jgi:hypothetical protein
MPLLPEMPEGFLLPEMPAAKKPKGSRAHEVRACACLEWALGQYLFRYLFRYLDEVGICSGI